MGSENLIAIETAQRVLLALAARHDPDPADVAKLRRFAPPLAGLPADELAAGVMRLAQTISAVKIDVGLDGAADKPAGKPGRCGLTRASRPKGADQLSRNTRKRQK